MGVRLRESRLVRWLVRALNAKTAYQGISDAIKKATTQTGRPMVFSVCNWGDSNPWDWAPAMSTMWRTSQDIIYYGNNADVKKMLANFDSAQHATAQSPGHYNDPDMLIVGMPNFTLAQNRTHMALWAISGAPLLAGNKLDSMSADTKSVLTNSEVLAIDQDPLAKQGTKVSDMRRPAGLQQGAFGNGTTRCFAAQPKHFDGDDHRPLRRHWARRERRGA